MEDTDNIIPVVPEIEKAEHPGGIEMTEWIFTDDPKNPAPYMLFHAFYDGVFSNKIGVMQSVHKETGEKAMLIVGVEILPEGTAVYPLARILETDEVAMYKESTVDESNEPA